MLSQTEIQAIRDRRIIRANELIQRFNSSFTAQQQKIILYVISTINPYSDEFTEPEFYITDFCQVCGLARNGQSYGAIKKDLLTICSSKIIDTYQYQGKDKEGSLSIFDNFERDQETGVYTIYINPRMKPYLLQLHDHFTQTILLNSLALRSKYALRLYDYICSVQYDDREPYIPRYTIDEMHTILGAENKYPVLKDFKLYVLYPAVREINKYTNKTIAINEIRRGRKITHIEIVITSKSPTDTLSAAAAATTDLDSGKKGANHAS